MLMSEVNRCLLCKNARCQSACPIHTKVPEVMTLLKNSQRLEAQKLLFEHNPLSAVCAIVCNHEEQCLGNCIRGIKGEPITFHEIERKISYEYLMNTDFSMYQNSNNGYNIAIVGAGPVGISGAIYLATQGHSVTIYEKNSKLGGVLQYGIPSFRLGKDIVDKFATVLNDLNVKIIYNTTIGVDLTLQELSNEHDAVLLGIGAEVANKLNISGEYLPTVHYAIEYLKDASKYNLNGKVIVLGAGNVAMDAARTSKRLGADTSIYYRKSFEDMKASKTEIEDTKEDGVDFVFFKSPVEITEEGVIFCDSENVVDDNGRVSTKIIRETEHLVKCDAIIIAVSQNVDSLIFETSSLESGKWGNVNVDGNYQTNIKNVFAAGDGVTGASSVVEAVNGAKNAVDKMIEYLDNN